MIEVEDDPEPEALKRDKDRLAEELDAATKVNLGVAVRNNHFGIGVGEDGSTGGDGDGGGGGRGGGNGISEEEMDETVNSLLEMITTVRRRELHSHYSIDPWLERRVRFQKLKTRN